MCGSFLSLSAQMPIEHRNNGRRKSNRGLRYVEIATWRRKGWIILLCEAAARVRQVRATSGSRETKHGCVGPVEYTYPDKALRLAAQPLTVAARPSRKPIRQLYFDCCSEKKNSRKLPAEPHSYSISVLRGYSRGSGPQVDTMR